MALRSYRVTVELTVLVDDEEIAARAAAELGVLAHGGRTAPDGTAPARAIEVDPQEAVELMVCRAMSAPLRREVPEIVSSTARSVAAAPAAAGR
ncbi:hypothetical protein GIS00_19880 [Nakamurella sp. YIM 132087]|uniref:Uncharacterized protein n=1 Tax=Nakamurella alba TaxID=2665158 RepID=A0A7K1FPY0_9ACTN|nr:hypothetical protein [Nakamurella alba]MTD16202.1 hypothetical protein [Nakamurella alba]